MTIGPSLVKSPCQWATAAQVLSKLHYSQPYLPYLQAAAESARLKGGSARLERSKNSRNSADKTTRLLIGILVLFLMAEVPQVHWLDIGIFVLGSNEK